MTFQQLQYLLEVSKANSISKAAANLFIATSSVSASVNSLEEELGFPIFVRNQKGLVPTQKGLLVLDHARRICQTYEQMYQLRTATEHHLRVCGGNYPPVCNAFARVAKEVGTQDTSLLMNTYSQDNALQYLRNGQLDVAVISQYSGSLRSLEVKVEKLGLRWERLAQIPYSICVSTNHRLAGKASVTLEELEEETLIDSAGYIYSTGFFQQLMKIDPDKVLAAGADGARQMLARAGVGYSLQILPPRADRNEPGVVYIPVEGVSAELVLVTDPTAPDNDLIHRYSEYLKEELRRA